MNVRVKKGGGGGGSAYTDTNDNGNNNNKFCNNHGKEWKVEIEEDHSYQHRCDEWHGEKSTHYRRFRIVFMEMLQAFWYNVLVGVGFRMLGNSWSFGILQGFAFSSMVSLFWYEDSGFANFFVSMGLCFSRRLKSKEYWIFLLHLVGQLFGGALAMGIIALVTNDLPGLQTFGTPTKGSLISETAAGFSEFVGSFMASFAIFYFAFNLESVAAEASERDYGYGREGVLRYSASFALSYVALSICFYDLTGSSFNFLRWALPRLCMGHFDLNPHDALYYLVGHFFGVALALGVVSIMFYFRRRITSKAERY